MTETFTLTEAFAVASSATPRHWSAFAELVAAPLMFAPALTRAVKLSTAIFPFAVATMMMFGSSVWSAVTTACRFAAPMPFTVIFTVGGVHIAEACTLALQLAEQSALAPHIGGVNDPSQCGAVNATLQEPSQVP